MLVHGTVSQLRVDLMPPLFKNVRECARVVVVRAQIKAGKSVLLTVRVPVAAVFARGRAMVELVSIHCCRSHVLIHA